jgi:hypothetical protein
MDIAGEEEFDDAAWLCFQRTPLSERRDRRFDLLRTPQHQALARFSTNNGASPDPDDSQIELLASADAEGKSPPSSPAEADFVEPS